MKAAPDRSFSSVTVVALTAWEASALLCALSVYNRVLANLVEEGNVQPSQVTERRELVRRLGGDPDADDFGAGAIIDRHLSGA